MMLANLHVCGVVRSAQMAIIGERAGLLQVPSEQGTSDDGSPVELVFEFPAYS